jgi:hypothetical protein
MFELGRTCFLEDHPLPPAGLTQAEYELATAVIDQLERFNRVGAGTLPLEALPP